MNSTNFHWIPLTLLIVNTFHHTTVFNWRSHFLYDTFERNSMFSTYKIHLLIYYIEHSMKLASFTYLQFCIQQSVENKKKWKESAQICMEFFISIDHCDTISGICIDLLESTRKSLWWYNDFFSFCLSDWWKESNVLYKYIDKKIVTDEWVIIKSHDICSNVIELLVIVQINSISALQWNCYAFRIP